jgi:Saxitoxin biosynthesis operon protein SxtJ
MLIKINWKPNKKEIFNFGLILFLGCALAAAVCFFRGKSSWAFSLMGVSSFIFLLSWKLPAGAKPFYWAWMGVGFVMGSIVSRVILLLIFYAVLTPFALFFKLIGRDALGIRKKINKNDSYWTPLAEITDKTYYDHLS